MALVCLWLAYLVATRVSRELQRSANILNSVGLLAISAVLVWQSLGRVLHPHPVIGWIPVAAGVFGALGNWGVARLLRPWGRHSPAIRLAYVHNLGDMYVSLAPVAAGVLVTATGYAIFDPVLALAIGVWLLGSTLMELRTSGEALLWPEDASCPHPEGAAASHRPRRAVILGTALLALPSLLGCGAGLHDLREPSGSLPAIAGGLAIAVLPFANETGSSLRVPPPRFARDVPGALRDPYDAGSQTALLLLQQQAAVELARRGYAVVAPERVAAALPAPPTDGLAAAGAARRAGFEGPVLTGTLRRFHLTETGLLQIWLDLALVDPAEQRILWSASARRPVKVAPAQTWQEILLDAGPPIFADAFGELLTPTPASAR